MKLIFALIIVSVLSLTAKWVYSTSSAGHDFIMKKGDNDKTKEISIVSSHQFGDMQVRFAAEKEGEATITILNEPGKIVLQQINQLKNNINIIPLKNATALSEGSYTLRIILNNETFTTRLLIWK